MQLQVTNPMYPKNIISFVTRNSQFDWQICGPCILEFLNWNLEMLASDESRKPEYSTWTRTSDQGSEPTTNSAHDAKPNWWEARSFTPLQSILSGKCSCYSNSASQSQSIRFIPVQLLFIHQWFLFTNLYNLIIHVTLQLWLLSKESSIQLLNNCDIKHQWT